MKSSARPKFPCRHRFAGDFIVPKPLGRKFLMPRSLPKNFSKNNRFQEKITSLVAHYFYSLWKYSQYRPKQRLSNAASDFLAPGIRVNSNWLISNCHTHLAYKHCHWLISISTGSTVKVLRMKTDYHWLISNDLIHAGYTDFHWLISISINPILKMKGTTLCGVTLWYITRHAQGDMKLGALTCLPPCHVTYLASCQNWSHDLAQCQVPVMWLGTLPSHVINFGNMPISLKMPLSTHGLHFFNHCHESSFRRAEYTPCNLLLSPYLWQRGLSAATELHMKVSKLGKVWQLH